MCSVQILSSAFSLLFKRFAHSAEPRHLGCSVVDLLGLCLCAGLWVCVFLFLFVRGSSCLGLLVYLLARSGAILGFIFVLWGCLGLCFEGSGSRGWLWGSLGAALAAQEAQSQIF